MQTKREIKKLQKNELTYEVITWGIIIIATLFVAIYFPYSSAFNALIYVLGGATFASTYWYLRSRRLFMIAMRNAEEALSKSRELVKQRQTSEIILEHSSDGIIILDDQKRIMSFSASLENLTNFKKEEVVGKIADQVLTFSGKDNIPSILEIILLPKDFAARKYRLGNYVQNSLKTKDGKFVEVEITYDSFKDPSSNRLLALAILRDITYEQEVRQRDREFVSMASHQLFTPLSMIRGFLSLILEKQAGEVNEKQQLYLDKAYEATKRLVSLVGSLLSTSRIEGERVQFEVKEFDLKAAIKRLVDEFVNSNQTRNNKITTNFDASPIIIEADEEKVSQIINNCLDNSIKYTDNGQITVSAEADSKNVKITVIDNGIGIPQNEIDRIGTKFYRAQNVMKRDTKGTGLGMFIAAFLLEKQGGKIHYDSVEGKGTTVTITLPLKSKIRPEKKEI